MFSPARLLPIFLLLFSQSWLETCAVCPTQKPVPEFLTINEEAPVGSTLVNFTGGSGTTWEFPGLSDFFRQETHQNVVSILYNKRIDMEGAHPDPQFSFGLTCHFPNTQPLPWRTTVNVEDVNEFAPQFQQASYSVNVSEDLDVGALIKDFHGDVKDPDFSNQPIQLEISGSDLLGLFSVTSQTRIVLAGKLDFDSGVHTYVINVTAREWPVQGTPEKKANWTLLTVHVVDVDDLSPKFNSRLYRLSLDEGSYNQDLRVTSPAMTAQDMDRGINAALNFSLDGDPRFSGLGNGSILVTGKFDRRVDETITLTAKAFQIDNPVNRYDEAVVFVTVNDVNDHSPVMSSPTYVVNVSESITPSDVILTVEASDDDRGNNSVFEFGLNDTSAMFRVQSLPPRGQIFLEQGKQLDFETRTSYTFQVFARETLTSERHSSNASLVTVNVLDENDNAPVFSPQQYAFNVNKTAISGHVVGQVNATDRDSGENGRVTYAQVYRTSELFHLRTTSGEIILTRTLTDSDVGRYTFVVKAEDSAFDPQKRRQSTAVVDINILDVNTAPPSFNQTSYHGNVSEDAAVGALVVHLQATDPDSRDVSRLQFSLQSSSVTGVFRLSPRGQGLCDLLLNGKLDRETVGNYTLGVTVSDGLYNASTRITVTVLDVNDNDPNITSSLKASVTEGRLPGQHVLTLVATDADAGENGIVSYSMATSSQRAGLPFAVNSTTGEITTTAMLDRENVSAYTFYVTAKDGGTPPRSVVSQVEVTVEDVNDNGPTFNQTSIVLTVDENSRPRYRVQARDVDLGRGGEVFYYALQDSGQLVVNASTGYVMATAEVPLGRVAYILVQAYNPVPFDPSCPLCSNATVNVTFVTMDINNNPPVFNDSYNITVPEGNVSNPILRVDASDGDILPAFHDVRYWLSRGDPALFRVDAETGDLYMTFAPDFDPPALQRFFNLTVSASNIDPAGTTNASTPVVIRISDVNDNAPVFTSNFIECNVSESTPANSAFDCRVNASDIDSENNQKITYAFINQNQHFTMNSSTGEITLTRALDYDVPGDKVFSLTASATDGGVPSRTSTARVVIRLENENDSEPEWLGAPYSWSVQETSPRGAILGQLLVSDRDGDRLAFSLRNASLYVNVSSDGILRSTRVLDLEGASPTPSPLYVWVEVTDGDHVISTVVEVTVTPVNEFTPAFSRNYTILVNESLECGKAFLTVEATDEDSGQEGHVTYLLLAGNSNNTFHLDTDSGEITLNCGRHLDASWRNEFILSIMAKDGGAPPRAAVQGVVVTVTDQNTRAPRFLQSSYSASVRENLAPATRIVQVSAVDADTPADHLHYLILSVSGGSGSSADVNNFTMTSDGWLLTNGILDADVIPSGHVILSVGVNDGVFNATAVVNVTVEDMNDNPPEISLGSPSGNFSVPENAAVNHLVAQISATDRDRSNTGFTYWMTGAENKFRMNMSTGAITVRESLDRAIQPRYNVTVHVSDHGSPPLFAESDVVIDVTDSNRAPYFNSSYSFYVNETAPVGSIVGHVLALDPDLGSSGRVSYSIENSSQDFIMENIPGGGVLKVARALDFETHATYILALVAKDASSQPRSAFTTINVLVVDEFEPPVWASPLPTVVLVKSASCQSGQLTALAQDLARASGKATLVKYSLLNATSSFTIDENSGRLQVNRTSVAEGNYTLLLQACNGDAGHLCSNATLKVLVTAENLLAFCPAFLRVSVLESMVTGHVVADVNTTAGDGGGIAYTLRSSSGDVTPFVIDPSTGVVTVNGSLDREARDSYTLFIDAISSSRQTAQAQIVVVVEDVVDSLPQFPLALYEGEIAENATDGTLVMERGGRKPLEVTATDRDLNVVLQYSAFSDTCGGCFSSQDDTGSLILRDTTLIDREAMTSPYIHAWVQVRVRGHERLSAVTNVSVLVLDVNDNWPQFSLPVYHANVSEGEGLGRPVVTVAASDRDQLDANGLRYSLQGCEPCPFYMDPVTGMVIAKHNWTMDRETTPSYNLTVVVKDTANHTNTSLVHVKILDVNDNDPTFNATSYNVSVNEGPDSRNWTLHLPVFDADENENANLSFSLKSGNNDGKFALITRGNQPVLVVQRDLDRETTPSYTLTVQAADAGRTPRTGTCLVTVHVMDINDETPIFSRAYYTASVIENANPGTSLVTVPALNATDKDSGVWGTAGLRFSLSNVTTFTINPRNATITVNSGANLDRERQMIYQLQVLVADTNGTGLSATANLTVVVSNENDETPQFQQPSYSFHVTENSGALTPAGSISATDADGDTVVYSLEDGGQGRFIIDRLSGELKVAGGIDREIVSSFRLNISASDGVHINFTDVTVLVDDVNDNCPTFSREVYEFDVAESIARVAMGNVSASDPDFERNGTVLYSVNASVPFSVGSQTGQMTTQQELDRETRDTYEFAVFASDQGTPPCVSSARVKVTVTDVNDHAPSFCNETSCSVTSIRVTTFERVPVGSVIALPDVRDLDTGVNALVTFTLTGSGSQFFHVNNATGLVTVEGPVDINALKQAGVFSSDVKGDNATLNLTLTARDHGSPPLNTSVALLITMQDSGVDVPLFNSTDYSFSVIEGEPIDTLVGAVQARMRNGSHATLTYILLTQGLAHGKFAIDRSTGQVRTAATLDREQDDSYSFVVEVRDGRTPERTAYTMVSVSVADVNDNAPHFLQPAFQVSVAENATRTSLLNLTALDPDLGENGTVSYNITAGNTGGNFIISADGMLGLLSPLNREENARFVLNVVAEDEGAPTQSSTATVTVMVEDVNDNAPVFDSVPDEVHLVQNYPGMMVVRVTAQDKDIGLNGQVFYQLLEGQDNFTIGILDGVVRTYSALDLNGPSTINLTVMAYDLGQPPLNSTRSLKVNITSASLGKPHFSRDFYSVTVAVGTAGGTELRVGLTAGFGDFTFNITGGDQEGLFTLDPVTASLRLARTVTHVADYLLVVRAVNNVTHTYDDTRVFVSVARLDLTFTSTEFKGSVTENVGANVKVVDVNCVAELKGLPVLYAFVTATDVFSLNSSTGVISTRRTLDREQTSLYTLTVSASLAASTSTRRRRETNTVTVVINVDDVNDNEPSLPNNTKFGVARNADLYTLVGVVKGEDKDQGFNAELRYRLTDGQLHVFDLDASTGELRVASRLEASDYQLTVTVTDQRGAGMSAKGNVLVVALDNNERFLLITNISVAALLAGKDQYMGNLSNIIGLDVRMESVNAHSMSSGQQVDPSKSDLYFYAFDPNTTRPVGLTEIQRRVTTNEQAVRSLFGYSQVTAVPSTTPSTQAPTRVVYRERIGVAQIILFAVAGVVFVGSLIAIFATVRVWMKQKKHQERMEQAYKARMKQEAEAEKRMEETSIGGDSQEQRELLPRTLFMEEVERVVYFGNEHPDISTIKLRHMVLSRHGDGDAGFPESPGSSDSGIEPLPAGESERDIEESGSSETTPPISPGHAHLSTVYPSPVGNSDVTSAAGDGMHPALDTVGDVTKPPTGYTGASSARVDDVKRAPSSTTTTSAGPRIGADRPAGQASRAEGGLAGKAPEAKAVRSLLDTPVSSPGDAAVARATKESPRSPEKKVNFTVGDTSLPSLRSQPDGSPDLAMTHINGESYESKGGIDNAAFDSGEVGVSVEEITYF